MKKIKAAFEYDVYGAINELSAEDRNLLNAASSASSTSYAPYSKFQVGAAVLLENGEIVMGSNQENAAYPSGLCAERVALFSAGTQFPGIRIKAIAITAHFNESDAAVAVTPCGDCRQVMAEYEHRFKSGIRLIMSAEKDQVIVIPDAKTLLPLMFNSENLIR